MDLEVDDPQPGEIQVKLVASGLCHSDEHIATGDIPVGVYPFAGGHEGAGIVTKAGGEHKGLKEGDHVVFSFLPSCGHCRWCASGMQNLCDLGAGLLQGSRWADPSTFRLKLADGGQPSGRCAASRRSCETTTVVRGLVREGRPTTSRSTSPAWSAAASPPAGARRSTRAGSSPATPSIVMGIGGIGINAVQGAAHAGACNVIAVDPVAFKREKALEFGATHAVETMEEATELAKQLTNGQGADKAIVTVGVIKGEHIGAGDRRRSARRGTVVVTALGDIADATPIPISLADAGALPEADPGRDVRHRPTRNWDILRHARALPARASSSSTSSSPSSYTLDEINQGYQDMHDGKNIRGVIHEYRPTSDHSWRSSACVASPRYSPSRSRPGGTWCWRGRPAPASPRCCGRSRRDTGQEVVFVEGNAELTPARLVGQFDPSQVLAEGYRAEHFVDGPLITAMREGGLLYIEELNRVPEETLNVLITVLAEGEIAVPRLGTVRAGKASG